MSRENATAWMMHNNDNLEQPPHILLALFDLLRGEGHPTSFEQEQQLGHLAACVPCQDALRTLLAIELDQDRQYRQVRMTGEPIGKPFKHH